jgi:uncharacterized protein
MTLGIKLDRLKSIIKDARRAAVAFSGGVDSAFLLKVAHDVLQNKVTAVTVDSCVFSKREMNEAVRFTESLGIDHVIVEFDIFDIEGFSDNPPQRCYLCKKVIFGEILKIAKKVGIKYIADGSNVDDLEDYRPGMAALEELEIASPLREAGLTKPEIRAMSREMGLTTWDRPAAACLASRIPYGHIISRDKLKAIEKGEKYLLELGFKQVRVRHHGDMARIEVADEERELFFNKELMDKAYCVFKDIGFKYAALDLRGYRTGSLNETVESEKRGL